MWQHEDFEYSVFQNDVSVLKLDEPLEFNDIIKPMKLADLGTEICRNRERFKEMKGERNEEAKVEIARRDNTGPFPKPLIDHCILHYIRTFLCIKRVVVGHSVCEVLNQNNQTWLSTFRIRGWCRNCLHQLRLGSHF